MIDFIIKLPILERYDIIIVIVDRLTKYAYIIPTTETINAGQIANIILRYIVINYGIPSKIISDRDKLFISNI
jgi:hypothetical protein